MGVDVAWAQLLFQQLIHGAFRSSAAEVDHDWDIRDSPGLHRLFYRDPFRSHVVGGLDAYDDVWILLCHCRRWFGLHVGRVVLELSAAHAMANDVEHGKNAGLRSVDNT